MAYFIWSGASLIAGDTDTGTLEVGAPILVLASKADRPADANGKTGDMWQFYIIRADMKPTDAIKLGLDAAVCGNCPHRSVKNRTCYTYGTTAVAANGMYRAHIAGKSKVFSPDMVAGDTVRLGAYGDPCAVPLEVWQPILAASVGWTAYTHQWRDTDPAYAAICQASCDSLQDQADATALGWRTYTVAPVGTTKVPGAVPCPSPRVKCETCLKCSGTGSGRKGNVWIEAHGSSARRFSPVVGRPLPLSVVA